MGRPGRATGRKWWAAATTHTAPSNRPAPPRPAEAGEAGHLPAAAVLGAGSAEAAVESGADRPDVTAGLPRPAGPGRRFTDREHDQWPTVRARGIPHVSLRKLTSTAPLLLAGRAGHPRPVGDRRSLPRGRGYAVSSLSGWLGAGTRSGFPVATPRRIGGTPRRLGLTQGSLSGRVRSEAARRRRPARGQQRPAAPSPAEPRRRPRPQPGGAHRRDYPQCAATREPGTTRPAGPRSENSVYAAAAAHAETTEALVRAHAVVRSGIDVRTSASRATAASPAGFGRRRPRRAA